jgi:hypothetical protein
MGCPVDPGSPPSAFIGTLCRMECTTPFMKKVFGAFSAGRLSPRFSSEYLQISI